MSTFAQNIVYNRDFTDEDAHRLCQYAMLLNHPQNRSYSCGWVTGHGLCGSSVPGSGFSEHLRSHHGIAGSEKTLVVCYWNGCNMEMKKESLMRHVNERHLELKYPCPNCFEWFTRQHTMQSHVSRRH